MSNPTYELKHCINCIYKLNDVDSAPCNNCYFGNKSESDITPAQCEYCNGKCAGNHIERKKLMINNKGDYFVIINKCNYLEDSVIGHSCDHSLFGIKINYCPMCGGKL